MFAGGCTLEAAGAVSFEAEGFLATADSTGTAPAQAETPLYVLDRLAALVEKNLLLRVEQEDGEPRFMMLVLLREYGLECLAASGEAVRTRQRYLSYFLSLAETVEPKLTSQEQLVWLARLDQEYSNLHAALSASLELPIGAELGLRLASALWWFWYLRGSASEWQLWLEPLLALTVTYEPGNAALHRLRATALYRTALLLDTRDDHAKAEALLALFQQALALCREVEHSWGVTGCLEGVAGVLCTRGQHVPAVRLLALITVVHAAATGVITPAYRRARGTMLANLRAQLDAPAFALAWAEGEQMTLEQATASTLDGSF